jgi:anaerobic selenocysteine-containing dehydrogenase
MLGKPAAGLLPLRGHSNVQGIGTVGVKPVLAEDVLLKMEQHLGVQLPRTAGMDTLACLNAAHEGKIDAALIMGGNLFSATPNSEWARAALNKIGFKVYLTTTLNHGHIAGMETSDALILPVTARDEEWQSTTQESMFNYVRLSDGGIERLHNVKPEVEILCEFAQRLLPNCPLDFKQLKQHDSIRAYIAATIPGLSELKDIGITKQEFTIKNRLLDKPHFKTANGKAEFKTNALPQKSTSEQYPFLLASIRSEGQFNSIIYEESDSYRGTDTRWSVLMNHEDIKSLGIKAGDFVTLKSPQGEMKDVKVFSFDLPRGNLMAYYPEANILISTAHDPRSKTPAFKSVAVSISVG